MSQPPCSQSTRLTHLVHIFPYSLLQLPVKQSSHCFHLTTLTLSHSRWWSLWGEVFLLFSLVVLSKQNFPLLRRLEVHSEQLTSFTPVGPFWAEAPTLCLCWLVVYPGSLLCLCYLVVLPGQKYLFLNTFYSFQPFPIFLLNTHCQDLLTPYFI